VNRVYICSCFGITEQQVRQHADDGRCTPRQIASACKAGTDCGSCVRRIQALLGRGAVSATGSRPERTAVAPPVPAVLGTVTAATAASPASPASEARAA
jgi:bacterioferritin-associated ferredoxin